MQECRSEEEKHQEYHATQIEIVAQAGDSSHKGFRKMLNSISGIRRDGSEMQNKWVTIPVQLASKSSAARSALEAHGDESAAILRSSPLLEWEIVDGRRPNWPQICPIEERRFINMVAFPETQVCPGDSSIFLLKCKT
jgi:hypothetical protein